ncbi:protein C14orf155, putative [Perkinsus marinus ATCC 50983]|uniref:Protein C14orf155, putative n=1 Tax=Perkinsus marinus (strain ATCC 50983 / TXsc) TaxID=423536 RepID=C5LY68_PERM5|nr:protein C14orf155, putative [Perkinsus marinus ATCC 50983]EEQ98398.1 protein C14orf155, putative [Perkinsus marinus ATCC 50983]|eukprot:XP_002765681.1 protein C14orf155, putative [Perkinsus marinus ATCC 50983]
MSWLQSTLSKVRKQSELVGRQVRQGTQQIASATSKLMEDISAAGSLPVGSTTGLRTCQEVSEMLEAYIDELGAHGSAVRRLPGLVESLNRWNEEIALGNDAKQRFIDTPEGVSPTQLQSIPPNQITALTFRQVFLRSKCLEKLLGLCARDASLRVLMRDLASVGSATVEEEAEEEEDITIEKMFRFMMYRLLGQCLRGQATVWQQLLESVMQTSEDLPVNEELVAWLEKMVTALKLDWKDDHYHDKVLNTMRRLKADMQKEADSPVSSTSPQVPSAAVATLTCQLHRTVSLAKERRIKSLAQREAAMKEVVEECEAKMVEIDKDVDTQATEIAELEEQVKNMHTEVHEQLEALKPNGEEIEGQMKTLEEEKEKLEKRLMEINEELDTLAARKSSIEQAEGQLMRSDKDTSEHFEARIAEQQLHQRQEADLKGYIATFKSVVLVGNDELTSVSANQVAEMDAKMVKTREKAETGATEFLLKEAAYLAVLKAEMESPDSPGEHVLQLLRHADKAWMTVDRFGRQYGEYIGGKPDAVAALERVSDLYSACKDAAEPHKLEAMERIHRGMSEDITAAAPVMSIATPKSSEGGSSPQVQPPLSEEHMKDVGSPAKMEEPGTEPAPSVGEPGVVPPSTTEKHADDGAEKPPLPPVEEKKVVPPPPPPPPRERTSEGRKSPQQQQTQAAENSDDDEMFADLLK